jgi:heme oxygenase
MTTNKKPLWEETRELHHACEQHAVGGAMATGKPPRIWYAAWLVALEQIHSVIDNHMPDLLNRTDRLSIDISEMQFDLPMLKQATVYTESLTDEKRIAGAAYVLTGAHLMGGEIMRRRLEGFPTKHLEWDDRKEAIAILQTYRTRDDIGEEAKDCFKALLAIMDEIESLYPITTTSS